VALENEYLSLEPVEGIDYDEVDYFVDYVQDNGPEKIRKYYTIVRAIISEGGIQKMWADIELMFKVPKGNVFLCGDNSLTSLDSRQYGPIPYGLVKSKALFKVISYF
jgi:hypothetical protein